MWPFRRAKDKEPPLPRAALIIGFEAHDYRRQQAALEERANVTVLRFRDVESAQSEVGDFLPGFVILDRDTVSDTEDEVRELLMKANPEIKRLAIWYRSFKIEIPEWYGKRPPGPPNYSGVATVPLCGRDLDDIRSLGRRNRP